MDEKKKEVMEKPVAKPVAQKVTLRNLSTMVQPVNLPTRTIYVGARQKAEDLAPEELDSKEVKGLIRQGIFVKLVK